MADENDSGAEPMPAPSPPVTASPSPAPEARKRPENEERDDSENTISPVLERSPEPPAAAASPSPAQEPALPPGPARPANENQPEPERFSVERGDVPDAIKRRYYAEEPQFSPEVRFFTDAKGQEPAFRDAGGKLVARDNNPDVVKDLVAIAEHRGWKAIEVRGDDDFRRAVWLEARIAGLEVRGYKPVERDLQELARHQDARDVNAVAPDRERAQTPEQGSGRGGAPSRETAGDSAAKAERVDYDKGVTGKLLESGEAPYKHRSGQELTPFVRVERANGRQVEVWGVGLPAALERSGAQVGDEITLRRDGVEKVSRTFEVKDKATGELSLQQRQVPRNRWTIEAERFRAATPAEAARDPALREAQSRLAVVAAVVKDRHPDPAVQERLIAGAKEKIAGHIAQGGRFTPARVREPEAAKEQQSAERGPAAEASRLAQPEVNKVGPERTRGR